MKDLFKKKVCYVSGAISSDPDYRDKFYQAEEKYLKLGYQVINPARIDDEDRIDKSDWKWKDYIIRDILIMLKSDLDAIVMLPTWRDSRGSLIEFYISVMLLGIDVIYEKENEL